MSAMKEKIKGFVAGLIFRVIALLTLGQISPILSACVIIEQDGKILLIDRSDGLGYTIPGGIVRYRETVEQCVVREVREETGYTVVIHGIVGVYSVCIAILVFERSPLPIREPLSVALSKTLVKANLAGANRAKSLVTWPLTVKTCSKITRVVSSVFHNRISSTCVI